MLVSTIAELGDYDEDTDVANAIQKLPLFPQDAADHMEKIMQEYRTLKSVLLQQFLHLSVCPIPLVQQQCILWL